MSRRIEIAYEAESPGKSAQHDKAQDSGDTVKILPPQEALATDGCFYGNAKSIISTDF
jgi:hypothetical protein